MSPLEKIAKEIHEKYLEEHRRNKAATLKVNKMMTAVGVLGPFATSVQAIHIFSTKMVAGISPLSWSGYIFVSLCWAAYGFFHKDKPLIVVNSLSLAMNFLILTGYFLYN